MIIESLGLTARRDSRRELEAALSFLVGPTGVEAGCVACHLYRDVSNPNSLRLECLWATEADFIRHLSSETYKQVLQLMELSVEPPNVQFHQVLATQGMEVVHATRSRERGKAPNDPNSEG